jgi:hypothetical protein
MTYNDSITTRITNLPTQFMVQAFYKKTKIIFTKKFTTLLAATHFAGLLRRSNHITVCAGRIVISFR